MYIWGFSTITAHRVDRQETKKERQGVTTQQRRSGSGFKPSDAPSGYIRAIMCGMDLGSPGQAGAPR